MKFGVLRGKDECLPLGYGSTTTELLLLQSFLPVSLSNSHSLSLASRLAFVLNRNRRFAFFFFFFSLVFPLIRLCCSAAWAGLLALIFFFFLLLSGLGWAFRLWFVLTWCASVVYIVVGSDINYNHINKIINIILFVG